MLAKSGSTDGSEAAAFFHSEYRLNELLFSYPKPTVAVMDGITMGGGVGISLPCTYRVATENTRFAMPETSIGLFPDVGGGWYLSRLPGRVGQFMVLTGARLDGAECHYLGLATHYVAQASLEELIERITNMPERLAGVLGAASVSVPEARIAANQALVARHFASDELEEIEAAPRRTGRMGDNELVPSAPEPLSCKVSLRPLEDGGEPRRIHEERVANMRSPRTWSAPPTLAKAFEPLLIDKDNARRWASATAGRSPTKCSTLFAPLPEGQRWTPFPGD